MPQPKCLFRFRFATCILPRQRVRIRIAVTDGSVRGIPAVPRPGVVVLRRWCPAAGRRRCHGSAGRGRWCSRDRQRAIRSSFPASVWARSAHASGIDRRWRRREAAVCDWRSARAGNPAPAPFPWPMPRPGRDSREWGRASMLLSPRSVVRLVVVTGRGDASPAPGNLPRTREVSRAADETEQVAGARSSAPAWRVDPRAHWRSDGVRATAPRSPSHGSPPRSWPRWRGSDLPLTSCHLRILYAESVAPEMNPELCHRAIAAWRGASPASVQVSQAARVPWVRALGAPRRRGHAAAPGTARAQGALGACPLSPIQRRAGDENGHPSVIIRARPLPCRPWTRSNASPPCTAS